MPVVRISQQHNEDRLEGTLAQLVRGANPPKLRVYGGTMPASTSSAPGAPLVAEFTLPDPPGFVSANKLTLYIPPNALVLVDGDITWARFINGDNNASMDVDVSATAGTGAVKFDQVTGLLAGSYLRVASGEIG
jgi:hypothetical protein